MSALLDRQAQFAMQAASLIHKAFDMGYQVTLGDAFRDPRVFGHMGESVGYGHRKSAHKMRIAIDLNLFRDGLFLTTTEDHRPLGEWWESVGGTWGGRFGDANHYSFEHEGIK